MFPSEREPRSKQVLMSSACSVCLVRPSQPSNHRTLRHFRTSNNTFHRTTATFGPNMPVPSCVCSVDLVWTRNLQCSHQIDPHHSARRNEARSFCGCFAFSAQTGIGRRHGYDVCRSVLVATRCEPLTAPKSRPDTWKTAATSWISDWMLSYGSCHALLLDMPQSSGLQSERVWFADRTRMLLPARTCGPLHRRSERAMLSGVSLKHVASTTPRKYESGKGRWLSWPYRCLYGPGTIELH